MVWVAFFGPFRQDLFPEASATTLELAGTTQNHLEATKTEQNRPELPQTVQNRTEPSRTLQKRRWPAGATLSRPAAPEGRRVSAPKWRPWGEPCPRGCKAWCSQGLASKSINPLWMLLFWVSNELRHLKINLVLPAITMVEDPVWGRGWSAHVVPGEDSLQGNQQRN